MLQNDLVNMPNGLLELEFYLNNFDKIVCHSGANVQKNSRPKKQPENIDYISVNQVCLRQEPKQQPEAI